MRKFRIALSGLLFCALLSGCASAPAPEPVKSRVRFAQRGPDVMVTVDNDILFDIGKYTLRQGAGPVLDILVTDSLSRTTKDFVVEGHTDSRGTEAGNHKLSEDRAGAVKSALVARGILSSRIKPVGFGSTQPLVKNAVSEDDHQLNRRAVILIKNELVENVKPKEIKPDSTPSLIKSLGLK